MIKEIHLSVLRMFCSYDEGRETLRTPWKNGNNYFASDGLSLIMIPSDVCELDVFDDTNINKRPDAIKVIPTERMEPIIIPKAHMQKMLADSVIKKTEECAECRGRGEVKCNYDHHHDCQKCGASGEITTYEKMSVRGVPFRSELLQRICNVAHRLNYDEVTLVHYAELKPHLFEIGKITVLIMPIAPIDYEEKMEVKTLKKLI